MSMRRGIYGTRQPRVKADEHARFLIHNAIVVFHQKRNLENKCTNCWDELAGDYSPACPECAGSGFVVILTPNANLPRKKGFVSFTQPYGNFGNAGQTFKAGGQHTRYSAYLQFDKNSGKDIERGDRLIANVPGLRVELVAMNNQPQMAGMILIGFVAECVSVTNVVLEEVFG